MRRPRALALARPMPRTIDAQSFLGACAAGLAIILLGCV